MKSKLRETSFKKSLLGYCNTLWFSDVAMVKSVLKASKCDDNPLTKVARAMKWNIELTGKDIENLEIYVELIDRLAIHTDRFARTLFLN